MILKCIVQRPIQSAEEVLYLVVDGLEVDVLDPRPAALVPHALRDGLQLVLLVGFSFEFWILGFKSFLGI